MYPSYTLYKVWAHTSEPVKLKEVGDHIKGPYGGFCEKKVPLIEAQIVGFPFRKDPNKVPLFFVNPHRTPLRFPETL